MAELQSTHEQAWQNFVTDTEQDGSIKYIVGEADHSGHGNHITAYQAHVHARFSLSYPVTHSRDTCGKLCISTGFGHRFFNNFRIFTVGLMGGDHIIIR